MLSTLPQNPISLVSTSHKHGLLLQHGVVTGGGWPENLCLHSCVLRMYQGNDKWHEHTVHKHHTKSYLYLVT